jgi:hypothetical protein
MDDDSIPNKEGQTAAGAPSDAALPISPANTVESDTRSEAPQRSKKPRQKCHPILLLVRVIRKHRREFPKWTDIAIVGLTGGIVFLAYMQHRDLIDAGTQTDKIIAADERLAKAMEDSVAQAKSGLDASIAASRTDQRAWIDMIIYPPPNFQEDKPFTTAAEMKNLGKTPARNIMFGYFFEGIPPTKNPIFDDSRLKFIHAGLLPPQGPSLLPVEITPEQPNELLGKPRYEAIRKGELVVYFWGLINYDDVFGFHHWLKFCYIYNAAHQRFNLVSTHNGIDEENR